MAKVSIKSLPDTERIFRATAKLETLVSHTTELIKISEQNQIIVYSPTLSAQVTNSRAANAFNDFQESMFRADVIRGCVLWDKCDSHDLEKISIPAVVRFIDEPSILDILQSKTEKDWGDDFGFNWGKTQSKKNRRRLEIAIRLAKYQENSPRITSLRNHRDKFIAHSLQNSRLEINGVQVPTPKYGYERRALYNAVSVLHWLYIGVTNRSFDWRGSVSIAKKNSEALWKACRFDFKK